MNEKANLYIFLCENKHFLNDREIVIWGAWERGKEVLCILREIGMDVAFFVDKKPPESGCFCEKKVLPIETLAKKKYFVIMAIVEHKSAYQQLLQWSYQEYQDFWYLDKKISITKCRLNYQDVYKNEITGNNGNAEITISGGSKIQIGKDVVFEPGTKLIAEWNSRIVIGDHERIAGTIKGRDSSVIIIGNECKITSDTNIEIFRSTLRIGHGCKLEKELELRGRHSEISIGEECLISYRCMIRGNQGHTILDMENKNVHSEQRVVSIGKHVWIGMGAMLLPGADIGDHCIVGAGALVNKTFGTHKILAGVPARCIRENVDWDKNPDWSYDEYMDEQHSAK